MKTIKIQLPTPGRVVLFAWGSLRNGEHALNGVVRNTDVLPAVVIEHQFVGRVHLAPVGVTATFERVPYGADENGQPLPGHWCYPPIVREEIEIDVRE